MSPVGQGRLEGDTPRLQKQNTGLYQNIYRQELSAPFSWTETLSTDFKHGGGYQHPHPS